MMLTWQESRRWVVRGDVMEQIEECRDGQGDWRGRRTEGERSHLAAIAGGIVRIYANYFIPRRFLLAPMISGEWGCGN
jgi:hypothetical protein